MPEYERTAVDELKAFLKSEALRPVRREASHQSHLRLRQLEVFLEAAKHENFGAASRALGVSPAYVSEAITSLERELGEGTLLFDRDTGGARLTRAGKVFAARGEQLLGDEAAARSAVGSVDSGETGVRRGVRGRDSHLKLRQIEVFLEAARHENFGSASKRLGVSPAYISEAIASLERDLGEGTLLFDRDSGGASLTHAGKVFAARGEQLLRDEAAARNAIAGDAGAAHEAPISARQRRNAENVCDRPLRSG
jgi:DNA-binding transcriptional LysR family regulator